jgi:hypothetical protein
VSNLSPDFEALSCRALAMTRPMLERFGGFYPFGLGVDRQGELVSVPVCDDEDQPSGPLIDALRLTMRTAAVQRRFVASAVIFDATLSVRETGREFDVVAVELDDRHGRSIVSYVPYSGEGAACVFGDAIIDPGGHEIFGDLPAPS